MLASLRASELHGKFSKIHLRLFAGRRLKPPFELRLLGRADLTHKRFNSGVAILIPAIADFPHQMPGRQIREQGQPLPQIRLIGLNDPLTQRSVCILEPPAHAPDSFLRSFDRARSAARSR